MMKISMTMLGLVLAFTVPFANAEPVKIELPADTSTLRESTLPGYTIALQKCGICHSADYISFQPPGMSLAQWTAEMSKMQHSYGAPLDEEEIGRLGAYLAVTYGSAKATDADASAILAASIRQGGVGKWGQVPMPPMSGLSDTQLQAVVDFILEQ
jgi:mono/diheme cytochrome c family protein